MRVDPTDGIMALGITSRPGFYLIDSPEKFAAARAQYPTLIPHAFGQTFLGLGADGSPTAVVMVNVMRHAEAGVLTPESVERTLFHELAHVRQHERGLTAGHVVSYASLEEYLADPLEIDARMVAEGLLSRGVRAVYP